MFGLTKASRYEKRVKTICQASTHYQDAKAQLGVLLPFKLLWELNTQESMRIRAFFDAGLPEMEAAYFITTGMESTLFELRG